MSNTGTTNTSDSDMSDLSTIHSIISLNQSMNDLRGVQTYSEIAKLEEKINALIADMIELHKKLGCSPQNIIEILNREND